jgi:hypothetical protein
MDGKIEVLEKMGLKTLGRKCPVLDEKITDMMPVLVERFGGDHTYAIAKWDEEKKCYSVIYDPCFRGMIVKILNGYAQKQ